MVQLSAKSCPRMGHIGHAQVIATIESTEDIGGGLYAEKKEVVKPRL